MQALLWAVFQPVLLGIKIDGIMNTEKYHQMLIHCAIPSEQVSFIFEHDNDPKRAANAVKRVMDWPPQSLELNIIEEEWDQKTE